MKEQSPESFSAEPCQAAKAPYHPPKLSSLGSLTQLTAGPHSGFIDMLFGGDGGFTQPDETYS